ncbi:MAG TPA: nuclear transport factor 2 family protein [Opitutaceae bacterium]|nr:nuclear transport factor 2 family protein [Opitutaceae bacterium]
MTKHSKSFCSFSFLLLALACGLANAADSTGSSDESILRQLNDDYIHAFLKSDVARYDALLAPDFRCIAPNGILLDRASFLSQSRSSARGNGILQSG